MRSAAILAGHTGHKPHRYNPRPSSLCADMTAELTTDGLKTIIDLIRYGASRFNAAGLTFGHSYDNALDEATQLVLHALHMPHDLSPVYGQARVTAEEKSDVLALFTRRIGERVPAAYLTGEAWFAGLSFKSDARALVPRSPIAELIERGFEPWLGGREVLRALDLCTGSGCIAIAMGHYNPDWHVDGVDLSDEALSLANENKARLQADNVRLLKSDLFSGGRGGAAFQELHDQHLAEHMARDAGRSLAASIVRHIERRGRAPETQSATRSPPDVASTR